MPRQPRLHAPGAFYHVTLRGNHRQDIFFSARDRTLLDELIAEVIVRFMARVHAYCWMTNHVHLIVQVGDTPLGRIMLRIASRYARQTQAHLRTTGHLFERRYHAVMVDADEYLLELLRYIHLNPVRAGIVERPIDYPWSSHQAYLGLRTTPWVTTDFALSMFHHNREQAVAAYDRFVEQRLDDVASPLTEIKTAHRQRLRSRSLPQSQRVRPARMSAAPLPTVTNPRYPRPGTIETLPYLQQNFLSPAYTWLPARPVTKINFSVELLVRSSVLGALEDLGVLSYNMPAHRAALYLADKYGLGKSMVELEDLVRHADWQTVRAASIVKWFRRRLREFKLTDSCID